MPHHIDWKNVFLPDTPVLEIIVRGSITYLALFTLLRVILRRESGNVSLTDMLVIVLIADASQNAMAGGYNSLPDGIILVAVIIGWSHLLNWLGYRWPFFQRLINSPKLLLVDSGQMIRKHMRRELITEEELMSAIRKEGYTDLKEISKAYMESDGSITVIPKENRSGSENTKGIPNSKINPALAKQRQIQK